jgi:ATP/maltotriose-dependent transcriptional regulator MalT
VALYSEARHGRLVDILNHDPKTVTLVFTAPVIWMLGHPEQAVRMSDDRDADARRRGHPFNLGFALTAGAQLFGYLSQPDEALKRAAEAEQLGRENSIPYLTEVLVPLTSGTALIRKGQFAEGVAALKAGLVASEQGGGRCSSPFAKSVLAERMAELGDLDGALDLIDESIAQIERPGWEERSHYAEILRIKGGLLSRKGDPAGAERSYIASLDWARQQQAAQRDELCAADARPGTGP